MQEKISFMEHIRASLEMLAGGVLWAAFGGVFGTALEAWAARVNGRRMGFWDYVIAYIIAVSARNDDLAICIRNFTRTENSGRFDDGRMPCGA